MSAHLPAIIIIVPLISAFVIAAASWINPKLCFPIVLASMAISLYSAIGLLFEVLTTRQAVVYYLGGWAPPWGIAYYVDHLNGLVLVVVSAVAFINLFATRESVKREFPWKLGPFYTLYTLFVTGLLGIVVTGDVFNLYVLLEIASLTGYALIGMGKGRAPLAGLNYIFMGTIGASFYLLGIGYLYMATGSLNMVDIASILPEIYGSRVVSLAFVICMTGLFIKMAFFPFTYLAAGCLCPFSNRGNQPDCTFDNQGDDICDDSDGALCLYTPFCVRQCKNKQFFCLARNHCNYYGIYSGPFAKKHKKDVGLHSYCRGGVYGGGLVAGEPPGDNRRDTAYCQ